MVYADRPKVKKLTLRRRHLGINARDRFSGPQRSRYIREQIDRLRNIRNDLVEKVIDKLFIDFCFINRTAKSNYSSKSNS